jgi:hypothetical protein
MRFARFASANLDFQTHPSLDDRTALDIFNDGQRIFEPSTKFEPDGGGATGRVTGWQQTERISECNRRRSCCRCWKRAHSDGVPLVGVAEPDDVPPCPPFTQTQEKVVGAAGPGHALALEHVGDDDGLTGWWQQSTRRRRLCCGPDVVPDPDSNVAPQRRCGGHDEAGPAQHVRYDGRPPSTSESEWQSQSERPLSWGTTTLQLHKILHHCWETDKTIATTGSAAIAEDVVPGTPASTDAADRERGAGSGAKDHQQRTQSAR